MGSLPDLTERARPPPRPAAARTISDPHRHRTQLIPVSTICKKEWPWKKQNAARGGPGSRRRDSVASSVGAASVRRLINRQPPKVSPLVVRRFTLLCVSSAFCATGFLPFTAFVGAEAGGMALALMHAVAAVVAPLSPLILQKTGVRVVISIGHALVCVLVTAHTVDTPLPVLYILYAVCGLTLSPLSLAMTASATTFAQHAGDEGRRKVALRRALRALRAAQDAGLVVGALLMGAALMAWPDEFTVLQAASTAPPNVTAPRWPPPDPEYFMEDDYEEQTCGAAGCPATQSAATSALSIEGRRVLLAVWALLAFSSISLGVFGAASTPSPPPDTRSIIRDPRTLFGVPMGLFIGLQQGFIYTSYIKWYGVCVGGWACAWRALFGAGALQTLAAATLSMAAARGRRRALAAGGAAAHASLMLALLRWRAVKTDLALPAVAASAWGACAALWDVLQSGICIGGPGWRGPWSLILSARHLGLAASCAARQLLCASSQLVALAAVLVLALASHMTLEIHVRKAAEAPRHRS